MWQLPLGAITAIHYSIGLCLRVRFRVGVRVRLRATIKDSARGKWEAGGIGVGTRW